MGRAFARAGELHREHGLSATLVFRGGGPVEGFQALNAYATVRAAAEAPNLVAGSGMLARRLQPWTRRGAIGADPDGRGDAGTAGSSRPPGIRAERALTAYDAALAEDLERPGASPWPGLRRVSTRACAISRNWPTVRLRQLDRGVERSLLTGPRRGVEHGDRRDGRDRAVPPPVEVLGFGDGDDGDDPTWDPGWRW